MFCIKLASRLKCFFLEKRGFSPQSEHGKNFSPSWVIFSASKRKMVFRSFPKWLVYAWFFVEKTYYSWKGQSEERYPTNIVTGLVTLVWENWGWSFLAWVFPVSYIHGAKNPGLDHHQQESYCQIFWVNHAQCTPFFSRKGVENAHISF